MIVTAKVFDTKILNLLVKTLRILHYLYYLAAIVYYSIKLFGNSVAIAKTLEIGEGYAPNIFSCINNQPEDKTPTVVSNPHQLNFEEMMELADFNIQLWMDLKANIRRHGVESSKIFNRE